MKYVPRPPGPLIPKERPPLLCLIMGDVQQIGPGRAQEVAQESQFQLRTPPCVIDTTVQMVHETLPVPGDHSFPQEWQQAGSSIYIDLY